MAYAALLASVPDDQIAAFREERCSLLEANLIIRCSHILTSWVQPIALRNLLRHAIDGGQKLRSDLWHPLRNPAWHPASTVSQIENQLHQVWNDVLAKHGPLHPNDWYAAEISKVLRTFKHASEFHNGVVSFLEPPLDSQRAQRVSIPLVANSR